MTGKCQLSGTKAVTGSVPQWAPKEEVKGQLEVLGTIRRLFATAVLKRFRLVCYRYHPPMINCTKCSGTKSNNYLVKNKAAKSQPLN